MLARCRNWLGKSQTLGPVTEHRHGNRGLTAPFLWLQEAGAHSQGCSFVSDLTDSQVKKDPPCQTFRPDPPALDLNLEANRPMKDRSHTYTHSSQCVEDKFRDAGSPQEGLRAVRLKKGERAS